MPDAIEQEVLRLRAQRDRAWRTLMAVEDSLEAGAMDEMGLGFLLAGSHGPCDSAEWETLRVQQFPEVTR